MRRKLAKFEGVRKKFKATFSKLGKKVGYNGYSEETILLTNVIDAEMSRVIADHVWFSFTKGFENARLTIGNVVTFEARVKEYTKGYVHARAKVNNQEKDYKLSHPTKIAIVE
jgi:hypothetical protein